MLRTPFAALLSLSPTLKIGTKSGSPPDGLLRTAQASENMGICELANMITDNQVQTLRKTAAMMLAALQHGTPPKELQAHLEAAETQSRVLEAFSKAAQAHPKALAMLESPSKGKAAAVVFNTVADAREVLRETAMLAGPDGTRVALPESAPPTLGIVDGQIRLVTQPAWMWLLSMLNPLQPGRLRICEKCARLYVAARRDQLGCSARCGDAIFMRKYRGPNYRKRTRAAQGIAKAKDAMERRRLHLALREENQRQQQPPAPWKLRT